MSIRCNRRSGAPLWSALALLSLLIGFVPGFSQAEPPPESLTLSFDTGAPIVLPTEFSEPFTRCEDGDDLGEVCVTITSHLLLATDSRGKITGSGGVDLLITAENDPSIFSATLGVQSATGSIKRSGARAAALNLKVSLEGDLIEADRESGDLIATGPVKSSTTVKGTVNGAGVFTGTLNFRLKGRGISAKFLLPSNQQLPGDSGWQLVLSDVTTDAKGRVSGRAAVALRSGGLDPLQFALTGKYSTKNDLATLKLKPLADPVEREATRGTSLSISKLKTEGDDVTGGELAYKFAGQSGKKLPVPTEALPNPSEAQ